MRNETVHGLRGIACFAVCVFHFAETMRETRELGSLLIVSDLGRHGVTLFFVISGFVVPLAMQAAGYALQEWPRFLLRRLVRLEPAYLVSLALALAITLLAPLVPGYAGPVPEFTWPQIASHLGYLSGLLGFPWVNFVYWTLAIEIQFYLLISLLLPLLLRVPGGGLLFLSAVSCVAALAFDGNVTIAPYAPTFCIGIAAFLFTTGAIKLGLLLTSVTACLATLAITQGLAVLAIAGIAVPLLICDPLPRIPLIAWLGTISYSLYLVHQPIGSRIVNLLLRLPPSALLTACAFAAAMAGSLVAAYVLYRFVEEPSQRLSKAIETRNTGLRHPPAPAAAAN